MSFVQRPLEETTGAGKFLQTNSGSFGITVPGATMSTYCYANWANVFPAQNRPSAVRTHEIWQVDSSRNSIWANKDYEIEPFDRSVTRSGSITLAKATAREILGQTLIDIKTELKEDPEDVGQVSVCLVLTVDGTVDEIHELDRRLQHALMEKIPTQDFPFIGLLYQFD